MHFKVYLLLYTHLFFFHSSNAFNITAILNQYPSFSTFNRYLSETNLATEINLLKSVTVLAVPNDVVSRLSGEPPDVLKDILRVHVVAGYYDIQKFRKLTNKTCQMTTLFQTTDQALGLHGFLKASVLKNGNVFIGSASHGSPLGAILVRSIACQTCNISVLHISTVIVPARKFCSNTPINPPTQPPALSPKSVPSLAPTSVPSHSTTPPPFSNTPMTTPSESPADTPVYSRESPSKPIDKPSGSPPEIEDAQTKPPPRPADTDTNSGTFNIKSGLNVVIIIVLSSIYIIVQI